MYILNMVKQNVTSFNSVNIAISVKGTNEQFSEEKGLILHDTEKKV